MSEMVGGSLSCLNLGHFFELACLLGGTVFWCVGFDIGFLTPWPLVQVSIISILWESMAKPLFLVACWALHFGSPRRSRQTSSTTISYTFLMIHRDLRLSAMVSSQVIDINFVISNSLGMLIPFP